MKITKAQMERWKRDKTLICVIQCRCGKVHEVRKKYQDQAITCQCGHILFYCCLINYARNKVLYRSKYMKNDNLHSWDLYQ